MEIYFLFLILLILKKKKIAILKLYTVSLLGTLMGFDENVDQMTKEVTS